MSTNSVPGINVPSNKQSPTSGTKPNRLPAPTLFVGPPSRNASQLSVARQPTDSNLKTGRPGASRQRTGLAKQIHAEGEATTDTDGGAGKEASAFNKQSEKSVDAKWREMQSTLNEVELTAQSSTQVFGDAHVKALDELRSAQVALAKAWGRGNQEQAAAAITSDEVANMNVGSFKGAEALASDRERTRQRADTQTSASTVLSDESQLSESSVRSGRNQLEDETAQDIKLASERRAANEAYFKKVDQGVKEVVEKLEKVAEAMRGVEGESRSLWSNSDPASSDTEPVSSKPVAVDAPAG